MVQSFTGGEVGINISPDTTGFRRKLERFLHSLDNDFKVKIDADPSAYDRALRERAGREYKSTIKIDGDYSALDQLDKQAEAQRKAFADKPLKLTVDEKPAVKSIRDTIREVQQLDGTLSETFGDSFSRKPVSELSKLDVQAKEYRGTIKTVADEQKRLATAEASRYQKQAQRIADLKKKAQDSADSYADMKALLDDYQTELKGARAQHDDAAVKQLRENIELTKKTLKEVRQEQRDLKQEYAQAIRDQNKAVKEYQRSMVQLGRTASEAMGKLQPTVEQSRALSSQLDKQSKLADSLAFSHMSGMAQWGNLLDDNTAKMQKLAQVQKEAAAQAEAFAKATDLAGKYAEQGARGLADFRAESKELTDVLDEQEAELDRLSKAFQKAKPYGIDKNLALELNNARTSIRRLREEAVRNPVQVKYNLDTLDWDRKYGKLLLEANNLREKLSKDNELNIRVRYWEDNAQQIEDRLRKLTSQRFDIPVDWQVNQKSIAQRMRDIAAEIKAHPERAVELEADLDLDMKRAEEQLKDFEDKNNKIEMDLDLKTAGARAHLAEFTRPRSIEIFAKFRGTDLGRIIDGIVNKGTGLATVNNQFSKLVDTFDTLDKVVPRYAMIASVFGSIAAGATNLTSSALGVGASLLTITQAALAAPAALTGLGAAFVVLRHAWGDKGGTLSEQIDLASTKIAGLGDDMDKAFYEKARPAIRGLVDDISGTLIPGITGVATAEGSMVAGLADVITQADKAGQLSALFDNTRLALDNLNPGLQNLAKGFLSLGDATSRYLPAAATYLSSLASKFSDWVNAARESGAIEDSMRRAGEQAGYLMSSIGSLGGVIKGLYKGLAESENGLQGFSETLQSVNKAVNSVKFQAVLQSLRDGAQEAQSAFRGVLGNVGDTLYDLRDEMRDVFSDMGVNAANGITMISRVLDGSQSGIRAFSTGIRQGFAELSRAVGDNSGMFNQLLTTAGTLSKTMGTTLANAIRVNAPLITSLAKAAQTVAEAFNSLPAPIQQVIALWATFGRMGKTAFDSLKEGMLSGIMQTLQYRKAMAELGITAGSTSNSMGTLFRAYAEANGWSGVTAAMDKANIGMEKVGASAGKTTGIMGKLKGAASGALGLLGGPWGVAAIAAFTGISYAVTDYNSKAQATEAATQNIAAAMENVSVSADEAGNAVSNLGTSLSDALKNPDYAESGANWLTNFEVFGQKLFGVAGGNNKFKDTVSAARQLGVSMSDLTKIIQNGGSTYDEFSAGLFKNTKFMDDNYQAANKVKQSADQMIQDVRDQIQATAEANGHGKKYVDTLMSLGNATDFMALKAKSAKEQQADLVQSQQLGQQIIEDETNARIRAAQAAASYQSTLASMGSTIQQVQSLAKTGQQVWDANAKSFDYTTEAGRAASNAITSLASSANDYLTAMIANGASTDQVTAKQRELAQQVGDTAGQLTNGSSQAASYANSLLMTPDQITTQVELRAENAKNQLLQYVSLLEATFPNGANGQATYNTVLNMVASGALTTMDEVNAKKKELLQGLKDGTMAITVDADGNQAVMTMTDIAALGGKLQKDGTYKVNISADDQASPHLHEIISLLDQSGLSGKQILMFLNAEGNAKLTIDEVRSALSKLGMSDQDIDILLNAHGNAPEQMDKVRAALKNLGATDDQIEWFLNAIDNASPKMDEVEKKKNEVSNNPASFTIDGDASSAQAAIDSIKPYDGAVIAVAQSKTEGNNTDALNKFGTVQAFNGVMLAIARSLTEGNNTDALNKFRAVQAFNGLLLAFAHSLTDGNNNDAIDKFRVVQGYQGRTLATAYAKVIGEDSNARNVFAAWRGRSGSVISTSYVDIVTRHKNEPMQAATGGEIHGPGTGTSDSIPTMLSNGEFVVRAASVKMAKTLYGANVLHQLNTTGTLPPTRASRYVDDIHSIVNGIVRGTQKVVDRIEVTANSKLNDKSGPTTTNNLTQNFSVQTDNPEYLTRIVGEKMRQYMR